MEQLEHFSHDHPLVFVDAEVGNEEGGDEVLCYGCHKSISGPAYNCGECKYFLHKKCAELRRHVKCPMHNEHPLTLYANPPYRSKSCFCNVCNGDWEWFTYNCDICQFDVDIICILEQGTIQHKGHHHPLTILLKEATFTCMACDTEGKDQSYLCTTCKFWIHKSCALAPTTINHPDHDHPLLLVYSFPYENRSFEYNCEICKERVHLSYWLYHCYKCRHFVHMKCATSDQTTSNEADIIADDPDIIRFPLTVDESIKLLEELLREVSLAGKENAPELKHFSHDHPLALFGDQSTSTTDEEVVCDCCIQPIKSAPFYGCNRCSYFLHTCCTDLPVELQHPSHPDHLLKLFAPHSFVHNFLCSSCQRYSNGFFYKCNTCDYCLDISCAFFPKIIKHEGHKHPLKNKVSDTKTLCNPCDRMYEGLGFGCGACDFHVHHGCVELPTIVKHDWDDIPLALSYPPYSDHPDPFFCEICEEEMYPKSWAYRSSSGVNFFHTYCVFPNDKYSRTKFGGTLTVENHPHTLTFVRKSRNKSPSPCDRCGKDCEGIPVAECAPCNFVIARACCEEIINL